MGAGGGAAGGGAGRVRDGGAVEVPRVRPEVRERVPGGCRGGTISGQPVRGAFGGGVGAVNPGVR